MSIDNFKTTDITINNIQQDKIPKLEAVQGEKDGRSLTVRVQNGGIVEPQPSLNLNLGWKHRTAKDKENMLIEGLDAFKAIDREKGIFRIEFTSSMMQPGIIDASIQFVNGNTITQSDSFIINVRKSPFSEEAVQSESSFTVLQEALATVSNIDGKIESIAIKKADKTELIALQSTVSKIPTGTPREIFTSYAALQEKYPNGASFAVLVLESDGETGYVYLWNGSSWQKGSLYQEKGLADKSVGKRKLGIGVLKTKESENLCRLENTFWDTFVNYQNGNIGNNKDYCYVVAAINPIQKYFIRGTSEQGCFKDAQGNYISGYRNIASFPSTIPSNAATIWQTFKVSQINDAYIGLDEGILVAPEVLDVTAVEDETLPMTKNSFVPWINSDFNFFVKERRKVGVFINHGSGNENTLAGYAASELIMIDPRTRWTISGTSEQFALYDSFGRYLKGYPYAVNLSQNDLDPRTRFIRISMREEQADKVTLKPVQKIDSNWLTKDNAQTLAQMMGLENQIEVEVKKDGTGDYISLRKAIEEADNNTVIKIYNDFRLEEEYSKAEIKASDFQGYALYKNHTLQGVGNVTLYANLDPTIYSAADIQRVSTVTVFGNGQIKNLTIVGESVRYAFHPETKSDRLYCENVRFLKMNMGTYCQAMAGGTRTGQWHKYKDCVFITEWTGDKDIPASYHTNVNFEEPSTIIFEDCSFESPNSKYQLRFGGMASNQVNLVELIGNRLSSVFVKEERMDGVGLDYKFRGRGNRELTFTLASKTGAEKVEYDFVEEVKEVLI